MKYLALLLLLAMVGCEDEKSKDTSSKWIYINRGVVRSIDWYNRSFLLEDDQGNTMTFYPICNNVAMPVWQGEVVQFSYRWYNKEFEISCYQIASVRHIQ